MYLLNLYLSVVFYIKNWSDYSTYTGFTLGSRAYSLFVQENACQNEYNKFSESIEQIKRNGNTLE